MKTWLKHKFSIQHTKDLIKDIPLFNSFGHAPYLFYFNRHTVSKGVAIGLFINFLPLPLQVFWALLFAFIFKANMPTTVALTWINNPLTFVPINLFTYKLGSYLTGDTTPSLNLPIWQWHLEDMKTFFQSLYQWFLTMGSSYFAGLIVVCFSSAFLGYVLVQSIWKISLLFYIRKRKMTQKKSS